jgi:hypothetical protein
MSSGAAQSAPEGWTRHYRDNASGHRIFESDKAIGNSPQVIKGFQVAVLPLPPGSCGKAVVPWRFFLSGADADRQGSSQQIPKHPWASTPKR